MTTTIEQANESLRAAVAARREAQAAGKPQEEWYDVSQTDPRHIDTSTEESQLSRGWSAAEVLERFAFERPGSLAFLELLEEVRQLHFKKTAQYGCAADPFENVTASAKCGVEPWRRALCDLSDCVVRMQRFSNGQPVDYENALIDAANWALICLLKLREANRG
jgi:hypothetical protein